MLVKQFDMKKLLYITALLLFFGWICFIQDVKSKNDAKQTVRHWDTPLNTQVFKTPVQPKTIFIIVPSDRLNNLFISEDEKFCLMETYYEAAPP